MAYYNDIPTLEGKLKELEQRVRTSETAPRLSSSSIGTGGLKIVDGGSLTIEDGGSVIVNDGGDILVYGGELASYTSDSSGYVRLIDGQLYFRRLTSEQPGRLGTDSVGGRTVLRLTPPTALPTPPDADYTTIYLEGKSSAMPGYALVRSEGPVVLSSDGLTDIRSKGEINIGSTGHTFITSAADNYIRATGTVNLTAQSEIYGSAASSITFRNTTGDWLFGGTDNYLWKTAGGQVFLNSTGQMTARTPTFYVQGNLGCSGTKPFKIVHPLDETKALVHAATESPVAGLEYWGEDVVGEDGTTVIALPDYYEALAAADWRGVFITPYGKPTLIAGSKIVDGKFTVTGTPGTEFSWLAKGRRGDAAGQFEVEPDRVESGIDANLVPDFDAMDTQAVNAPQSPDDPGDIFMPTDPEPETPILGVLTPQEPDEEPSPTPDPVDEEEPTSD